MTVTEEPLSTLNETYKDSKRIYIRPQRKTTKVVAELSWINDWSKYPASNLDLYAVWDNGAD